MMRWHIVSSCRNKLATRHLQYGVRHLERLGRLLQARAEGGFADAHPAVDPDLHIYATAAHKHPDTRPSVRPVEDAPEDIQSFSVVSNANEIRSICHTNVPGWNLLPQDLIKVDQVCEGLSNQNFKVYIEVDEADRLRHVQCVLFRVYGKGANLLYDMELEIRITSMLSTFGIGPHIYAADRSWRIEGWHYSVPLPNRIMKNPSIFAQVATQLGRLHKLSFRPDFPPDIKSLEVCSKTRLTTWGQGAQDAMRELTLPQYVARASSIPLDEMLGEREWLSKFLVADDPKIQGSGLDVVFSHWDIQENNILQTQYGMRLIDFEYAGMEHQAFDIANYFVECTIDYLAPAYPFYKTTLSDFPTDEEIRCFCSLYLSEYLEMTVRQDDIAVTVLSDRVMRFTMASHLLWALWGIMRAAQAPTFGGFDYLHYTEARWFMYKWSKRQLLDRLK